MLYADLSESNEITVPGLTQWDKDVLLHIQCDDIPEFFEVHMDYYGRREAMCFQANMVDGVATIKIPYELTKQKNTVHAWVYVIDSEGARTKKTVNLPIIPRNKPEDVISDMEESQKDSVEQLIEASSQLSQSSAELLEKIKVLTEEAMASVGESAYEIAVSNGFVGTVSEWLASLEGPQGERGATGEKGDSGKDGYTPIKGVDYFTDSEITEFAPAIHNSASGSLVVISDSSDAPIESLVIYGGTNAGDTGSITVAVSDKMIGVNLIEDGGFENATRGLWYAYGGIEATDTTSHSGTYSLRSYNRDAPWIRPMYGFTNENGNVDVVTPGNTYIASAWFKCNFTEGNDAECLFSFEAFDSEGVSVVSASADRLYISANDDEWHQLSTTLTLPDNVDVSKGVYLFTNNEWNEYEFYVDDVSLGLADDGTAQTITISTLNGLKRKQVTSGGNYVDDNGQMYLADTVELNSDGSGKIVQRVGVDEPVETLLSDEEVQAFLALRTYHQDTIVTNSEVAYMDIAYTADTKLYIDCKIEELKKEFSGN